jgi:5-formyltetrahydrofolate cyclo-ligase
VAAQSRCIHRLLFGLPLFRRARRVHCYLSFGAEVDTAHIFAHCQGKGQLTFAPYQDPAAGRLGSVAWGPGSPVALGRMGVPEPAERPASPVTADQMDVILLPGLGFDPRGTRLGFGKGYYDRFLAEVGPGVAGGPALIALAHHGQLVPALPREAWDIPVHLIVTNLGVLVPALHPPGPAGPMDGQRH